MSTYTIQDEKRYNTVLCWLFQRSKSMGVKLDLTRIEKALTQHLGSPHTHYKTIHIAGTNGKGSVSTKIAKALQLSGYSVGLYTSPHIRSYMERFKINDTCLHPDLFLEVFDIICSQVPIDEMNLTFFEITTLIGYYLFSQQRVDIAVIETGLGGRLDATNVIHPLISVITSIGLDHTAVLGTSIEQITYEKAGIIKDNTPIIIGPHVPSHIVHEVAEKKNAFVVQVAAPTACSFDQENSLIAKRALRTLQNSISIRENAIEEGAAVRPACRFEKVPQRYIHTVLGQNSFCQDIYLDVAHNPQGIQRLFEMLTITTGQKKCLLLYGSSQEKDVSSIFSLMSGHVVDLILTQTYNSRRAMPIDELYRIFNQTTSTGHIRAHLQPSLSKALFELALPLAQQKNLPLICTGSFFIMGELRKLLGFCEFDDPIQINEALLHSPNLT